MFESAEAAKRLGVKLSSLYVYVSRGLIESHRSPDGRRSLFAVEDIERLVTSRGGRRGGPRSASVISAITQITPAGPSYRGKLATSLLGRHFEQVAEVLWQSDGAPWCPQNLVVWPDLTLRERVRLTLVKARREVPFQSEIRSESVYETARVLVATITGQLTGGTHFPSERTSIAAQIASAMGPTRDLAARAAAVDAAMVLLADHELASSTRAVRLAAGAEADFTDAVLAGAGVAMGRRHGGSAEEVVALLHRCSRSGADRAIDDDLSIGDWLPGFSTDLYSDGDPRFSALRPFVEDVMSDAERDLFERVLRVASSRDVALPTVDFALGALVWASRADPEFATAIFIVSRIAGWAAHYLEELNEPQSPDRARAAFVSNG